MENALIEKLEKWVQDHPKYADAVHINLTTGKKFTIRDILEQVREEKRTGLPIKDRETLEIIGHTEKWIEGLKW